MMMEPKTGNTLKRENFSMNMHWILKIKEENPRV